MVETTIGHYKVLEKIGQGGMGEVYLAQDTTLDRKVALKFLPEELQQDSTARKRFLREAKSAAALDHPYICHIHEVGEAEGKSFISMEYVQGMMLQDKLAKGPLPVREAVETAAEIAEALAAAHKQNIVHRDLKPSNIMLTPEGHVKVMDFGLAKRVSPIEGEEEEITTRLTKDDSFLGTVPYMSPEQLRGQEVDARSDIFSFGVVLYEMLTGVHPFKKGGQIETANAVLSETAAPLSRYTNDISGLLQNTVRKMLAKGPDRRYQLVHDVRTDLEDVTNEIDRTLMEPTAAPPTSQTPSRLQPLVMAAGLVVLTAIVTSLVVWSLIRSSGPVPQPMTQFVITPDAPLGDEGGNELAISPDGRRVVYVVANPGTIRLLYIRLLDDLVSKPIPGTEGAAGPFFSPDGESVAFFASGKLKRVSVMGGPPMTLCDAPAQGPSGNWGPEGRIVFTTGPGGLYRVPATGGEPERLAIPDPNQGEVNYRRPHILPGGKDVLFTVGYGSNNFDTAVLSLETGEKRIVVEGSRDAYYLPTGHLSYGLEAEGTLVVVPFDMARIEVMGEPVPTLGRVRASVVSSLDYAFSDEGTLVYSRDDLQRTLVWVSRQGTERPLIQEKRGYSRPRISPDGTRLSVTDIDAQGNRQVWIYEMARGILTPFTFERGPNLMAQWTPDGERLAFHSHRIAQDIFWKAADGSGEAELLVTNLNGKLPTSWSPDSKVLAFSRRSGMGEVGSDWDVWLLAPEGQGEPQPLVRSPFNDSHAVFSPDGGWVAFTSDFSGKNEVYVKPYPGEGGTLPISTDGGSEPVWARNGNELFYRNGDKMMVVAVQTEPFFKAETPRLLFEGAYLFGNGASGYDISIDGEQFMMVKEQGTSTQIHVILNWFEELKRLAPTE